MKILMITRKVDKDDAGAGFVYAWIKKLAERVDGLKVICLHRGNIKGLEKIDIYSLGKERISAWPSFLRRAIYAFRFYKYIWRLRKDYDAVFVHMHVIYVLLAGFFWRLWGKKIGLWYAHIKTSFWAKIASYFVNYVFSPSGESFGFAPEKLRQTGHGIDTDIFRPAQNGPRGEKKQIISLGRISPVKEYDTLVEAVNILVNEFNVTNFNVKMVGQPALKSDFEYLESLRRKIKGYKVDDYFEWVGGVANKNVPSFFQQADVFVNMQQGGGVGKAVLEAMASSLVCVLCSPVYKKVLGQYAQDTIFEFKNPASMAEKIKAVLEWELDRASTYASLVRNFVVENHNLDNLMDKIVSTYE